MTDPLFYDSFYDPHLQTYFTNKNIQKHLRKIGLINRHGEIIPYKQYETIIQQRSRQQQIRTLLSREIVQRVIQLDKVRQANLRNQFEITAKRIIVQNIKESRQQSRQLHQRNLPLFNRSKINYKNISQEQIKTIYQNKENPSRLSSIHSSHLSTKTNISTKSKTSKIIKSNIKDRCKITMIYLRSQTNVDYQSNKYEIIIMQQHCGGENLIIFKNNIKPNEKFQFESHRHYEYPFALTLYVNGLIDCRISVCCEYKHKIGVPLGGKRGSFAILNIQGGQPCQTCRFNRYISNSSLYKQKSSEKSSICTDTSKNRPSIHSNSHRLLRTPSPYDQHENDTTISNQNDEYREAQDMYENLLKKLDDNDLNWEENGRLQRQLGNICKEGFGDYERALDHYLISLEILCQHISPIDIKLRNLYLSIGHIFLLEGINQNHLAIEYFQRVLDIDCSTNNINENNLTNDHNYLGLLYKNQENYPQSLFHFEKSLKYLLLINKKSNIHFYFDENYYLKNETIYDKKALESLSIKTLPDISELYFNLATIYQKLGQKQNALKHAKKALQLSTFDQNKFYIYQNYLKKLRQI